MPNADPVHPQAKWTWSPEFRRLCGFRTAAEYRDVMQSWSDRLHPDDVAKTFAAFNGHLADRTGKTGYDAIYRLRMPDNSYRWFRATGGCRFSAEGTSVRACGSLSDIHPQVTAEAAVKEEAARVAEVISTMSNALVVLAEGDLTIRINEALPPQFVSLTENFNVSVGRLEEAMNSILSRALGVNMAQQPAEPMAATGTHGRAPMAARRGAGPGAGQSGARPREPRAGGSGP